MTETLLTVREVAQRLQFSEDTVRELVQRAELAHVRRGQRGRIRVPESAVVAWVDANRKEARRPGKVRLPERVRQAPARKVSLEGCGAARTSEEIAAAMAAWDSRRPA